MRSRCGELMYAKLQSPKVCIRHPAPSNTHAHMLIYKCINTLHDIDITDNKFSSYAVFLVTMPRVGFPVPVSTIFPHVSSTLAPTWRRNDC